MTGGIHGANTIAKNMAVDKIKSRAYIANMDTSSHAPSFKWAALIAGLSLLLTPVALLAHHNLETQFDVKKPISLTGFVTKIDWSNPHVRLYIDVKDQEKAGNWELNMGSPNVQLRNGWKIDTYRPGDQVTVVAFPAKDGSMVAYGRKISRK